GHNKSEHGASERGENGRRKIDSYRNVSQRHERCKVSEHGPDRNARRMRNSEAMSDHNQFPAVGRSDRGSECPAKKKERNNKYRSRAEELGLGRRNPCSFQLSVRL